MKPNLPLHPPAMCIALAALLVTGIGSALAQTQSPEFQSPREVFNFLSERMPAFLKDDALRRQLVGSMLKVPLAPPLRSTFDPNKATKTLLGDGSVLLSTDCRRTGTPVGERDPGDCTASIGDENGAGAFTRFSYSKSLGFGNLKFIKRPAVPTQIPDFTKLPQPKLTDNEAYDNARKLVAELLGLPASELLGLPPGAKTPPVRSLNIQAGGEKPISPIILQKIVFLQRGFEITTPGGTGQTTTQIQAPGKVAVAFDADGLAGFAVQNWQELRVDPDMSADDTKSGQQLLEEMAEDLFNDGVRSAADVKFGPVISSDQRNQIGLLLPAVQVFVHPTIGRLDEKAQNALAGKATAGLVKEYALVNRKEDSPTGRPRGE